MKPNTSSATLKVLFGLGLASVGSLRFFGSLKDSFEDAGRPAYATQPSGADTSGLLPPPAPRPARPSRASALGVLATLVRAVRAAAWLLLCAAAGLARTGAPSSSDAAVGAGKGRGRVCAGASGAERCSCNGGVSWGGLEASQGHAPSCRCPSRALCSVAAPASLQGPALSLRGGTGCAVTRVPRSTVVTRLGKRVGSVTLLRGQGPAKSSKTEWGDWTSLVIPGIRDTCPEIVLKQEVLKNGFHRDLSIKVKFGESIEDLQTCRLLIKQEIPTGLFVDPYELASLQERKITEAVMISENFNIEAPSYLSKESAVLIYARQESQCSDCFQAFLPVHYRYHRPHSKDGETFIVVSNPDLLMYCDQEFPILKCWTQSEVAAPCALENEDICQWNSMKYRSVFKNVTLQVPVGLTIHTSLVCFVTLFITILCSALILIAVFKYGHFSL